MANEFIVKNGLIVGGTVVTSGTITINGALAATQSWVTSQAYLTSASLSGYATQSYVTSAISALIDAAPAALDTLNELAAALGDDASFSTTVTNSIAGKVAKSGDTMTGSLTFASTADNVRIQKNSSFLNLRDPYNNIHLYNAGDGTYIDANVHHWRSQGASYWMTLNGTGLGIGTQSPSEKLQVEGNIKIQNGGYLRFTAGSVGTAGFTVFNAAENGYLSNRITTSDHARGWGWELTDGLATTASPGVFFRVGYAGTSSYLTSGNFGIGTTSPSEKFHVSGAAIFDGGAGNSSTDSVVYITKSNNNDWGLYVNASGLDYGMYARVSPSAGYAIGVNNGTDWTTRITGNAIIYLGEKNAIEGNYDTWLRLNNSNHYTSGVYTPGVMRADGGFNVSGSTVWHAGNDGSGSGLDADTLDGLHASSFLLSNFGNVEGEHPFGYPSSDGWYKIAEVVLNGTCQSYNLWGEYRDTGYFDNSHYRIHITARAECDFLSNNESHAINVNIYGSSTNETYFTNNVRVILTSSSSNYRKYELQYYRATWDTGSWRLQTLGWTTYATSQTAGTSTGTPRVYYISKFVADNIYAANKISIGTSYSGFAANIAGTTYIIGASAWVNDAYGYVNASSPGTGFFPYSDGNSVIASSNTTRLFVNGSTGNIGIGTSSPSTKLEVNGGTGAASGNIARFTLGGAGGGTRGLTMYSDGSQLKLQVTDNVGGIGSWAFLNLNPDGGNVGIGTTTPDEKLQVAGNIKIQNETGLITDYGPLVGRYNTSQVYVGTGGNYSIVKIGRADGGALNVLSGGDVGIGSTTTSGYKLYVNGSTWINGGTNFTDGVSIFRTQSGAAEVMRVASNSNIGIGLTTPQKKLDVYGSAGILGSFGAGLSVGQFAGIHFGYTESHIGNDYYKKSALVFERTDNHNQGGNASGKIHFLLNNAGSSSATALTDSVVTIDSDANGTLGSVRMGIGTKNPIYPLQVSGSAYVNGGTLFIDSGQYLMWGNSNQGIRGVNDTSLDFLVGSAIRMTATAGGNVGIGTTSPAEKLVVAGGGNIATQVEHTNVGWFRIKNTSTGNYWHMEHDYGDNDLRFGTSVSNGLLTLLSNGNVGIGTVSPNEKLDVRGNIYLPQNNYIYFDNSGHYIRRGSSDVEIQGYNGIQLRTNSTTRVYINQSGNVGIGTTSPGEKLHVYNGSILIEDGYALRSGGSYGASLIGRAVGAASAITVGSGQAGDYLVLNSGGSERVRIDTSGNVGIGTASPNVILEANGIIRSDRVGVASQYVQIDGGNAAGPFITAAGAAKVLTIQNNSTTSSDIYFDQAVASTYQFKQATVTKMILDASGNVGIGTTSPNYKLDVNGSINIYSGNSLRWGSGDAEIINSGWNLLFKTYNGSVLSEAMRINSAGKVSIGTTDTNSDKSDFTVYTGGTTTLALSGNLLRVGDTDVNWSVALRSNGVLETYGQNLYLGSAAGNYPVTINPNGTNSVSFYPDYTLFNGLNLAISRTNSTHGAANYFRGDSSHLVIGTGGTLYLNYGGSATNITGNVTITGGIGQNNLVGRPYAVWGANGTTTGAVVIKFPGNTSNYGMVHAVIDIYEYNGNTVSTVIVGGHNWGGSQWYAYGANLVGQTDKQVRVAIVDGAYAIVIGDNSSSWSYGQVVLRKIQNGSYYANAMNVSEGYTVTQTASLSPAWISGDLRQLTVSGVITASGGNSNNWNTAYSWGNHASVGYLTSYTETNLFLAGTGGISTQPGTNKLIYTGQISAGTTGLFPTVDNSNSIITLNRHFGDYDSQLGFSSNGNIYYRKFSGSTAFTSQAWLQVWHSGNITSTQVSNWDTAYGWGNHASAGYLTSYSETDTLQSVTSRGSSTNTTLTSTNTLGLNVNSGSHSYININSTSNWSWVRLSNNGSTRWDIASYDGDALQFRPYGSGDNAMYLNLDGSLFINSLNDGKLNLRVPSGDSSDWNYINFIGSNGVRDTYFGTDSGGTPTWWRDDNGVNITLGSSVLINGNTAWHAGNDGSGSGLDADTVDGVQADSIVYGNARGTNDSVTTNNNDLDKTGYYTSDSFATKPSGVANWMYIEHIKLYNANTAYQKQLGYDTYDDRMWVRTKSGGAWSSWKQIWTSDSLTNLSQLTNGPGYITSSALSGYATTSYVTTQINNLINGAPGALDTLSELASALGNDASFATTVTNSIASKLSLSGGTMTGQILFQTSALNNGFRWDVNSDAAGITFKNTGDGDNNSYFNFFTEDNGNEYFKFSHNTWNIGSFDFMDIKNGVVRTNGNIYVNASQSGTRSAGTNELINGNRVWHDGDFSSSNISNWNTAYGWGDHSSVGYALNSSLANYLPLSGGVIGGAVTINGNLTVNGTITENSSIKLKENIETSEGNLEKVVNLRPVTYNKIGSQTTELGLIAEEVAEVYPEFVQYDENGEPVGVHYSRLTAALIGAVKELTNQVQELNKKING